MLNRYLNTIKKMVNKSGTQKSLFFTHSIPYINYFLSISPKHLDHFQFTSVINASSNSSICSITQSVFFNFSNYLMSVYSAYQYVLISSNVLHLHVFTFHLYRTIFLNSFHFLKLVACCLLSSKSHCTFLITLPYHQYF
jgi:hypothetical protein